MDHKPSSARTLLSVLLSLTLHAGLVAIGLVVGAFFTERNPKVASEKEAVTVTVNETVSAEPKAVAQPPREKPVEKPAATPVVKEENFVAQAEAKKPFEKPAPKTAKKIVMITDFSDEQKASEEPAQQIEPQPVVEVSETALPSSDDNEVAADESQAENENKSEATESEENQSENATASEAVASSDSELATETDPGTDTTSDEQGLDDTASQPTAATEESPQNFLTLRQAPGNRPPAYPKQLRALNVEGKGQLKYFVNRDGHVSKMELTQSTGSAELDQAALDAFTKYKFVPGQEGYTVHKLGFFCENEYTFPKRSCYIYSPKSSARERVEPLARRTRLRALPRFASFLRRRVSVTCVLDAIIELLQKRSEIKK